MNILTTKNICDAAKVLEIEPAILKALAEVESAGDGFLPDGRCKILFEGHIFWRQLVIAGINPKIYSLKNPDILYEVRDKTKYLGGAGEYYRLAKAQAIHNDAAVKATSWGMFQIMGFNYKVCGYADVQEFKTAMGQSLVNQLRAVVKFIQNNKIMYEALKAKDWATFARLYNGVDYAANKYDTKLANAYHAAQFTTW